VAVLTLSKAVSVLGGNTSKEMESVFCCKSLLIFMGGSFLSFVTGSIAHPREKCKRSFPGLQKIVSPAILGIQ
jgi:hypothetical protein